MKYVIGQLSGFVKFARTRDEVFILPLKIRSVIMQDMRRYSRTQFYTQNDHW
jgi:hypothetical protein